jgi:acyl-CoA thioester hydrolase
MEPIPEQHVFSRNIQVRSEHLDELHHVNNVVYVQYLQDIAYQHWHSVMGDEADKNGIWVVRRHEIDYLASAVLGDALQIHTWTGACSSTSWERHYRIIRSSDQKIIISAKSVWVWLDAVTYRPKRIDPAVIARFQ